jgi:hypothetical protein
MIYLNFTRENCNFQKRAIKRRISFRLKGITKKLVNLFLYFLSISQLASWDCLGFGLKIVGELKMESIDAL